jgi:hypothetical protein
MRHCRLAGIASRFPFGNLEFVNGLIGDRGGDGCRAGRRPTIF